MYILSLETVFIRREEKIGLIVTDKTPQTLHGHCLTTGHKHLSTAPYRDPRKISDCSTIYINIIVQHVVTVSVSLYIYIYI